MCFKASQSSRHTESSRVLKLANRTSLKSSGSLSAPLTLSRTPMFCKAMRAIRSAKQRMPVPAVNMICVPEDPSFSPSPVPRGP